VGSVPPHANLAPEYPAVIVGYGPVGRTLARLLRDNDIEPTIIEMNLETVRRVRDEGVPAVYGDASHRETLKNAGVDRAGSLILSASGIRGAEEVIRLARELTPPRIRILARTAYLRERAELQRAGADSAFSGEGEVALALAESVLRALGASPEQIDRERERVRADLFGEPKMTDESASSQGQGERSGNASPASGEAEVLNGESTTQPSADTPSRVDGRGDSPPEDQLTTSPKQAHQGDY
jgi:CPA2 family monovalent cation:H+ antiporter-2